MLRHVFVFVIAAVILSVSAYSKPAEKQPIKVQKYSEVEIKLDESFTYGDADNLSLAPGSEIQLTNNDQSVTVQIPDGKVSELIEKGVQLTVLGKFIFIEPSENQDITSIAGFNDKTDVSETGAIVYEFGGYTVNESLPSNGDWLARGIDFRSYPDHTILYVDVHYEVTDVFGFVYVNLSNEDDSIIVELEDGVNEDLDKDVTNLTEFAGEPLNQVWWLWVREAHGYGSGTFYYWSIKLYYDDGSGGYCQASGGCDEYISRVQIGSIDNSSGCNNYADYTSLSTTMNKLQSYPITITNGKPYDVDECGIWVDWNGDEDFEDSGETISVAGSPGTGPYTASIIPPADANLGDTRLRIRVTYNQPPTPCNSHSYGEVEDYTINVVDAPGYCDASGDCGQYIDSVQVRTINNTGTGCTGGYADYTSLSTPLGIGNDYVITV